MITHEQIAHVSEWCEKNWQHRFERRDGIWIVPDWRNEDGNNYSMDDWQIVGIILAACRNAGLGFVIQQYGKGHVDGYNAMIPGHCDVDAKSPAEAAVGVVWKYLEAKEESDGK